MSHLHHLQLILVHCGKKDLPQHSSPLRQMLVYSGLLQQLMSVFSVCHSYYGSQSAIIPMHNMTEFIFIPFQHGAS